MRTPLGKTQIGKFLPTTAEKGGPQQATGSKVTKHSLWKTSISSSLDADLAKKFVTQHSGHKCTESLQSFEPPREKQLR